MDKNLEKRILREFILNSGKQNELLSGILSALKIGADKVDLNPSPELMKQLRAHLPKKGVDYFTEAELKEIKEVLIEACTPKLGVHYFTPKQIEEIKKAVRPRKGVDYVDGKPGKRGKDGKDAKPVDVDAIVKYVIKETKDSREDKERALEIVRLLEFLAKPENLQKKDQRLHAKAIRGLFRGTGGGVAGDRVVAGDNVTITTDGEGRKVISTTAGAGLGGVIIVRPDGTTDQYLPAADTDTARGDALIEAFGDLATGDHLLIGPGVFDAGLVTLEPPEGVGIWGSGEDITWILSQVRGESGTEDRACVNPSTDSVWGFMTIWANRSTGQQTPFGANSLDNDFQNVLIHDCHIIGAVDGLHITQQSLGDFSMRAVRVRMDSNFDCAAFFTVNSAYIELIDCETHSIFPHPTYPYPDYGAIGIGITVRGLTCTSAATELIVDGGYYEGTGGSGVNSGASLTGVTVNLRNAVFRGDDFDIGGSVPVLTIKDCSFDAAKSPVVTAASLDKFLGYAPSDSFLNLITGVGKTPTGTVDGNNKVFTPGYQPRIVMTEGGNKVENFGYTWDGTNITMDIAPQQWILYL